MPASANPQTVAFKKLFETTGLSEGDFGLLIETNRTSVSRKLSGYEAVGDVVIGRVQRKLGVAAAATLVEGIETDEDWAAMRQARVMAQLERCKLSLECALNQTPITRASRPLLEDALAEVERAQELVVER